ncbi:MULTISPECIES: group III truncated hemoglobin [unclassified Azospirillum]|uniref:group III truncated hemoglobin n=1 Tax=unclassified Azospirillum TaxID=2630922 RepID=UPI000B74EE35|nr:MULTISPECIES: group III truncated hemoglobin [unclassified Azospirillum]SNS63674.1 hemoglobin [Azospirillum sp. RU38E]SNS82771.1 hemoglobin [Azospirillum sp. RU37A]
MPYDIIDDESIAALIVEFYGEARRDPVLGPIFLRMVGEEDAAWALHLRKVHDFWSSVMLATARYDGRPMQAHAMIEGLGPAHFARWLVLFGMVADRLFTPDAAAAFRAKADKMALALQNGIALARG